MREEGSGREMGVLEPTIEIKMRGVKTGEEWTVSQIWPIHLVGPLRYRGERGKKHRKGEIHLPVGLGLFSRLRSTEERESQTGGRVYGEKMP